LVGGAAVVVAAFLPWVSSVVSPNALDVPLAVLWSRNPSATGFKLGFVLVALGGLGAGLAMVSGIKVVRRLLGVLVAAATVDYVVQMWRAISDLGGGAGDVFDLIGAGVYVALVGGLLIASGK
jgi:hypothetical protein